MKPATRQQLDEGQREYLEETLGRPFVDCLPGLAETFKRFRQGFKGGSIPDYAVTCRRIRDSLRRVATVAKTGDRVRVADAIKGAAGPVRGWYLPWYVSRLIGPPGMQGMDPALMEVATPQEIALAAREAMRDPQLSAARGRTSDLAVYKLITTVRMAYELHAGKRASSTLRSRFLKSLDIVAEYVGWEGDDGPLSPDSLSEHAGKVLRDRRWNQDRRFEPYFVIARVVDPETANYPPPPKVRA